MAALPVEGAGWRERARREHATSGPGARSPAREAAR